MANPLLRHDVYPQNLSEQNRENINLYLDLMKRCVSNYIYGGEQAVYPFKNRIKKFVVDQLARRNFYLIRSKVFDEKKKKEGREWPPGPSMHTMIGLDRLDNLQFCVEDVLKNAVPGDLIETGVWRGGAVIFMRAILKAYGVRDRSVWLADSFEGLPSPDAKKNPADKDSSFHEWKFFAVPLETVKKNFERYGLLDSQVHFLKGWFCDTLPTAPIERLAVLRLDGDMYESTMDALTHLYPKLSVGGYLIVDDYVLEPCRKAIHDYRDSHNIREEIVRVDWASVYWQRTQ